MKTVQCSHVVRGPKKGRIYIHSPHQCGNKVVVADDVHSALCHVHARRRALIEGRA